MSSTSTTPISVWLPWITLVLHTTSITGSGNRITQTQGCRQYEPASTDTQPECISGQQPAMPRQCVIATNWHCNSTILLSISVVLQECCMTCWVFGAAFTQLLSTRLVKPAPAGCKRQRVYKLQACVMPQHQHSRSSTPCSTLVSTPCSRRTLKPAAAGHALLGAAQIDYKQVTAPRPQQHF